jgi:hypothetical protein
MKKHAFEPHKVKREQIKALHDDVLVYDMAFDVRLTNGGIFLLNDNGKGYGIRPRWGRVYATGPEQQDVTVGQWVLVEHGRWTRGLEIEDESGEFTLRKIDPECIMMISDEEECPKLEGVSTAVHIDSKTM